jgi:hypothetical protein
MTNKTRFTDSDTFLIHSRAEALRDGKLIDVTVHAKKAGIAIPTAITSDAWDATIGLPSNYPMNGEIEEVRLRELLNQLRYVALREGKVSKVYFTKFFRIDGSTGENVRLTATVYAVDGGGPVISIMLPGEDYGLNIFSITEREAIEFIAHLVAHLWKDEEADYLASPPVKKAGHIFGTLMTIQGWLLTRKKTS